MLAYADEFSALFGVGVLFGAIGAFDLHRPEGFTTHTVPLRVELTRFRMRPGTEPQFAEWMDFHRRHHAEMIATLDREKVAFESIFLDEQGVGNELYWLSVEGLDGAPVTNSPHPVDHKHIEFAEAVIDEDSKYNLVTQFVLIPVWLERAINQGLAPR